MYRITMVWVIFLFIIIPEQASAQQEVPILIYHSIDEFKGHGEKDLYVSPKNFEQQMIYLRDHGYTLLTFERWQDITKVNKPIFITVDDGYKNNLNIYLVFKQIRMKL